MKLKQFKEFINESIINPIDTKDIIGIVKSIEHIDSLDDINNALEDYNIHFSFYDEFFNSLGTQEEKDVAPPENIYTPSAIKFALYNKYIGKINFVVIDNFIMNRKIAYSHPNRYFDKGKNYTIGNIYYDDNLKRNKIKVYGSDMFVDSIFFNKI